MRWAWIGLLTPLALCSAGCGYSSRETFRSDISSVHVEIFESREFRRNLEFMLTEAVQKRIGSDTPYRVVSKGQADTILKGEIQEVRQAQFAPDFVSRQPRDMQMTLVLRLEWKDVRTGQILADRPLWLQAVDYLPTSGESEAFAEQKVVDRMADRIISVMLDENW